MRLFQLLHGYSVRCSRAQIVIHPDRIPTAVTRLFRSRRSITYSRYRYNTRALISTLRSWGKSPIHFRESSITIGVGLICREGTTYLAQDRPVSGAGRRELLDTSSGVCFERQHSSYKQQRTCFFVASTTVPSPTTEHYGTPRNRTCPHRPLRPAHWR